MTEQYIRYAAMFIIIMMAVIDDYRRFRVSNRIIIAGMVIGVVINMGTVNAEHITSRSININAVSVWIVFCKYCSHRIESPYHSISHLLQKSEAFQSVHHVTFILCYTVL